VKFTKEVTRNNIIIYHNSCIQNIGKGNRDCEKLGETSHCTVDKGGFSDLPVSANVIAWYRPLKSVKIQKKRRNDLDPD
jgi:hypothetical protein